MAVTRGRIGDIEVNGTRLGKLVDGTITIESAEITTTSHDSLDWEEFLQGRKNATIEASCRYDEADAGQNALVDAHFDEVTFTISWVNRGHATSGARRYSATAFMTSQPQEMPNDEENKISFTIRLTGPVTKDAVP